jgi:hypothetical protein
MEVVRTLAEGLDARGHDDATPLLSRLQHAIGPLERLPKYEPKPSVYRGSNVFIENMAP